MNLEEAIEQARREGRIISETRCAAFPSAAPQPSGWSQVVAEAGIGGLQIPPDILEEPFQQIIIDRAHELGWIAAHFRKARSTKEGGWRTAVAADGKGFFDLVLVRERIIYAEIKRAKGVQSEEQKMWAKRTRDAGGEVYLWRPADLELIERILSLRRPAPLYLLNDCDVSGCG